MKGGVHGDEGGGQSADVYHIQVADCLGCPFRIIRPSRLDMIRVRIHEVLYPHGSVYVGPEGVWGVDYAE